MRIFSALLIVVSGLGVQASAQQPCTGLACQQVACPGTATTSITGVVYAPNGTDPLPNVTVYIPNAAVDPFPAGVSCPVVGAPPSGSPIVGAVTNVTGSFELDNVPVGANIPLVIVSGRWRRQVVVPSTAACMNTALPPTLAVMPQNQTQGDIPRIAIATGSADQVECVLRKVGIQDSEFTDPGGTGRINIYAGSHSAGSKVDTATPSENVLMGGNGSTLQSYDVLMLPCEGGQFNQPAQQLSNLLQFANAGGRVYSSHFGYVWMYQNPPFDGVANWAVNQAQLGDGTATVDTSFSGGQTLSQWLQLVGATTTPGQMAISTLRHDLNGVIPPTQSWLALNNGPANDPHPIMQFVFDTPIAPVGTPVNQCGRVLFNEYHVENGTGAGKDFPGECSSAAMTPQEKLLEYSLFELTDEGGQPSLAPLLKDFGSEAVSFTTPAQTFTWTNNSSFAAHVSSSVVTGDFTITSNNCSSVAAGASCQISVVFTPTVLGSRTGTLTVTSSGNSLTASLTGTGTPGYSLSATSLSFGSLDVGALATQTLTLTSLAPGPLPVPALVTSGDYSVNTTACGSTMAGLSSCLISVTFAPSGTGPRSGTVGVNSASLLYSGLSAMLSGNGIDFSITLSPSSGKVVAGDGATSTATITPIAGFAAPLTLTCTVVAAAVASTCGLAATSVIPTSTVTTAITITTTSQYTVIGYGGFGGSYLWLVALGSGWLLWTKRGSVRALPAGLLIVLLAAISGSMSGCSGKLPAQHPAYTGPGNYTVTLTATDGFLVHSATYTLTVTAK